MGIWGHMLAGGTEKVGEGMVKQAARSADTKAKIGIMSAQDESASKRMVEAQGLSDASAIAKEQREDAYMDDEGNIITIGQFNEMDPSARGKFKNFKTIEVEAAQAKSLLESGKLDVMRKNAEKGDKVAQAQLKNAEAAVVRAETAAKVAGGKMFTVSAKVDQKLYKEAAAQAEREAYDQESGIMGMGKEQTKDDTWIRNRTNEIYQESRKSASGETTGQIERPEDTGQIGSNPAADIINRVNAGTSAGKQPGGGNKLPSMHEDFTQSNKGIMSGPVDEPRQDTVDTPSPAMGVGSTNKPKEGLQDVAPEADEEVIHGIQEWVDTSVQGTLVKLVDVVKDPRQLADKLNEAFPRKKSITGDEALELMLNLIPERWDRFRGLNPKRWKNQ